MENKLTIEHVFQYLPYNLEFITDKGRWTFESVDKAGWICVGRKAMYCENMNLQSIKPLLIPLSELTNQIADNYGYFFTEEFISEIKSGHIAQRIYEDLVKQHYDVKGLIDQGLALNKLNFK